MTRYALVQADRLNVRKEPGIGAARIGYVDFEEKVKLLEDCGDWLKVQYTDNNAGYVAAEYVTVVEEFTYAKSIEEERAELEAQRELAARQEISLKYLERIVPILKQNGLIEGMHGKGGGYKLTKNPEDYVIWDILCVAEGDMAPVACLEEGAKPCSRAAECRTLPMWQGYFDVTKEYFSNITIADLMDRDRANEYVI